MQSLKALAQSTFGEIKDALVDAVGDDDDNEEDNGDEGQRSTMQDEGSVSLHSGPLPAPVVSKLPESPSPSEASEVDPCHHEQHQALKEFAALQMLPDLANMLKTLNFDANEVAAELSIPGVAIICCRILRLLLPRLALGGTAPGETQRLLTSFNERYENLLQEHMALQKKCRDLTAQNLKFEAAAQQKEAWQSAHQAAIARIEQLSSENAELKERARSSKQGVEPAVAQLQDSLAQRDAELQSLADAMRKLEEIVEDQHHLSEENLKLKQELKLLEVAEVHESPESSWRCPTPLVLAETNDEQLAARCRLLDQELKETSAALEILLEEKGRRLEDQEFLVDRRLVASMLALYHEHLASGQRALAEQVLSQALQVLGGVPEDAQASRARVKAAAAAAEARLAEPLGHAFVDFLEKEATDPAHGTERNERNAPHLQASAGEDI
mmetsp:Transcript_61564/g.144269  ORF Transcript_61564/g.144269 Transcript_61564/m.144269 type:complete len:442 (+) Transcript_61564:58-1383(+)